MKPANSSREMWERWSKHWSRYWKVYEDQHLGSSVLERLFPELASPILLVGSGQGLALEKLRSMGFAAYGVDFEKEMIKMGKKRRGIESILADARELPFPDAGFKTVIIASGVIDYMDDMEKIRMIVDESMRVTSPFGNLLITFYLLAPGVEKVYRRLGIIDAGGRLRMQRMFKMSRDADLRHLGVLDFFRRFIPMLGRWSQTSYLKTLFNLTYSGITLPKYLRENDRKLRKIIQHVKKEDRDVDELIASVPDDLPYRKGPEIRKLVADLDLENCQFDFHNDCIMIRHYLSPLRLLKKEAPGPATKKAKAAEPVIEVQDLCKRYGKTKRYAVDRLNLSIGKGTIFGLLGPNGAGKTTTLMMLCGLIQPTSGAIGFYLGGSRVSGGEAKQMLGYVPQDMALYQKLTAMENLQYFGGLYGMEGEKLKQSMDGLLRLVGLTERADDLVEHFSTGMKRRLNLAIGLIHEPKILLLDEPTVGIDPQSRNCIFESVMELKKKDVTIFYTTHYMEEANKLCDRIAILDEGKILLEGPPGDLVANYGLGRLVFRTGARVPVEFMHKLSKIESVLKVDQFEGKLTINTVSLRRGNLAIIEEILKTALEFKLDIWLNNFYEPNLESLFLDITGRSLRDDGRIVT